MRIGILPGNLLERVAMWLGLVPTPIIETFHAIAVARSIMVATKLGVFESLACGPKPSDTIAAELRCDADAVEKLLNVLVTAGYLRFRSPNYRLTKTTRKWLLKDSTTSLHDNTVFRFLEWQAIERLEDFIRSGEHLDVHDHITDEQWAIYQRGMRSIAGVSAPEVAGRIPVPADAKSMLDIGGSHGFYAVSICRRYPELRATVLDLPSAIEHAAPILAKEEMGERISHRAADARYEDLGEAVWDIVFVSHLVHHFDEDTNRQLFARISKSLRPDGILAVLDAPRVVSSSRTGQTAALLDLFFAMTSNSGCWPAETIHEWMHAAELKRLPSLHLRTAPGLSIFLGKRT